MGAITIEADSQVAIVAEDTKSIWESLLSQPTVKSFALTNCFAVLGSSAVNMVYGEKFDSVLTAARAFAAIVVYEGFPFFSLLATNLGIRLLSVVSRPSVFDFEILSVFLSILFRVRILPSRVKFLIAFLTSHSQFVVSSGVFGEKFHRDTLLASITNSCPWSIASSIFGRSSIFLQDVLRSGICCK